MAYMDHSQDYEESYLQGILNSVKTIAMVGASPDKTKFSYGVLRVLHETGYDMAPINPRPEVTEIRGIPVYNSLSEVDRPIDMFRTTINIFSDSIGAVIVAKSEGETDRYPHMKRAA